MSRGTCSWAHFQAHPESQGLLPSGEHPQPGLAFHAPCSLTSGLAPVSMRGCSPVLRVVASSLASPNPSPTDSCSFSSLDVPPTSRKKKNHRRTSITFFSLFSMLKFLSSYHLHLAGIHISPLSASLYSSISPSSASLYSIMSLSSSHSCLSTPVSLPPYRKLILPGAYSGCPHSHP